jgi:hypothetical protein
VGDQLHGLERLHTVAPHHIVATADIRSVGIDRHHLARLVAVGAIVRVGHGTYRVGSAVGRRDPIGTSRALRAVISHESAAAWLGADMIGAPDKLHLTAPRSRGRRHDAIDGVHLHRADLAFGERIVVGGAAVTTPVRTVLDVARSLPVADEVAIGDSLARRGGLTAAEILSAAVTLAGPGRRAALRVAELIDPSAESVFESISRVVIHQSDLPRPQAQFNVFTGGLWIARVDFAWPDRLSPSNATVTPTTAIGSPSSATGVAGTP